MSKRRRRFSHRGVYFPDTQGVRAALIDSGQLLFCLEHLLRERGLLDARMDVGSRRVSDPPRTISVREALAALHSAYEVFSDCAAVVERVWQATQQCSDMIEAGEKADSAGAVSNWLFVYELVSRIADDQSPVRRDALTAAHAVLRRAGRARAREHSG